MAKLYVVSTPIGNLGDMTQRAIETLREVDVVMAEDTRRTGVLLQRFDIGARMISAHEHNEASRADLAVEILTEGRDVAIVTDAGTPLLSDPGSRIVRRVVDAGFEVVPIPGASALLSALVGSGIGAERFTFYGFIPRKGGDRISLLEEIVGSGYTSVIYESPQRLVSLLEDLEGVAGTERRVAVARELTKLHEEFVRGTIPEVRAHYLQRPPRGEVVVVVEGSPEPEQDDEAVQQTAQTLAAALLDQGLPPSQIAKELRDRLSISRNDAYALVHEQARDASEPKG